MRYLMLPPAAYVLLVAESTLLPAGGCSSYGALAWLLLPWIATFSRSRVALVAAGAYGLLIDCLAGTAPGLFMALTIATTAGLHLVLPPTFLTRGVWVALVCGTCSVLLSLTICVVRMLAVPGTATLADIAPQFVVPAVAGSIVMAGIYQLLQCVPGVRRGSLNVFQSTN